MKDEKSNKRHHSYLEALKKLTHRHSKVLKLGCTDNEIAGELNLSVRTVHSHKRNIYKELELSGRGAIPKCLWM